MNLSGIQFNSVQNAMASAYATSRPAPVRMAEVVPIRPDAEVTTTAGLASLLRQLGAGDAAGARSTVAALAMASSGNAADPMTSLLPRLAATLSNGSTADAMGQLQSFLVRTGRATGSGFSARV